MKTSIIVLAIAAVSLTSGLSNQAQADQFVKQDGEIGFGAVLSINTSGEFSVGARVFNKGITKEWIDELPSVCPGTPSSCTSVYLNSKNNIVATAGLNYNFTRDSFEPVIGVGYVISSGLFATEVSYSLRDKKFNWNLSGGWSNAEREFLGLTSPVVD